MLAHISYWMNCLPAQQAENALMSANGGLLMGSWVVEVNSDLTADLLKALRVTYVDKLVSHEKKRDITASQTFKLDAVRQLRWVFDRLARKNFPDGVAFQLIEPLESQLLNVVHNIRVEYP